MEKFDITLCFCPYGYFEIQYSNAYLKSYLHKQDYQAKCLDLNIEFFKELGYSQDEKNRNIFRNKYGEMHDLMNVGHWTNEKAFYESIFSLDDTRALLTKFADQIIELGSPIVGFSIFETNRYFSFELAKKLKELKPDLMIIFGGPDCTSMHNTGFTVELYDNAMKAGVIDLISIGESEVTLTEVMQEMEKSENRDFKKINGLRCLHNDQIIFTGSRELIQDINSIPFPDYSDFDVSLYEFNEFPIVFNRGCPYRCTYCNVKNVWSDLTMRIRSAENLVEEVKYQHNLLPKTGHKWLAFKGAYINTSGKLLSDLSDRIIEEWDGKPDFLWTGYTRVNKNLSEELCKKMRKAGCAHLIMGLESASENVTKPMLKAYPQAIAKDIVRNIGSAKILCSLFIIVGFPTESEADFQMTLDFLEENQEYLYKAYCQTEFLLSPEMFNEPEKWNLKVPSDGYYWETNDGFSTHAIRKERLQRFYKHLEKFNLNAYALSP